MIKIIELVTGKLGLLVPRIVIIDIKKYNVKGIDYNTKLMAKVKEKHDNKSIFVNVISII